MAAAGQPLLEKVGRQLYLTPAGEAVASACRDIFDRLERLAQERAAFQGMEKGSLRLAIITTAKYFVHRLRSVPFISRERGSGTRLACENLFRPLVRHAG